MLGATPDINLTPSSERLQANMEAVELQWSEGRLALAATSLACLVYRVYKKIIILAIMIGRHQN